MRFEERDTLNLISCSHKDCKMQNPQAPENFGLRKEKNNGRLSKCKNCYKRYQTEWRIINPTKSKETTRSWREKNPERQKDNHLKNKFGISLIIYKEMFLRQEGKCLICKKHRDNFKNELVVDHCHRTGKVRGLLCSPCNSALGFTFEETQICTNMIDYIINYCKVN